MEIPPLSNIPPLLLGKFSRYAAKKKKEQAKHLVILKFLLPEDASPVEYNTVLKNSPPLYTAKKKERLNQLVI